MIFLSPLFYFAPANARVTQQPLQKERASSAAIDFFASSDFFPNCCCCNSSSSSSFPPSNFLHYSYTLAPSRIATRRLEHYALDIVSGTLAAALSRRKSAEGIVPGFLSSRAFRCFVLFYILLIVLLLVVTVLLCTLHIIMFFLILLSLV